MTEEPDSSTIVEETPVSISVPVKDDYTGRITRTLIAVGAGCIAGVICFFVEQATTASVVGKSFLLPVLIMLAAIILQKHIFMLIFRGALKLEKKDWIYQGFITFAFWFVTWTIILSETTSSV
jgi:hypothetical protein